jgi:hypothetical protein
MFRVVPYPSSGAHTTVSTASGICNTVIATCRKRQVAIILGDRNVIKKEAEKILKYKRPYNRNITHVECKTKGDTSNNRRDLDHFKVI